MSNALTPPSIPSLDCDVLVAGGGAAGIAAAVAAARAGARTVLLERGGFLGGTATAGLVGTICGLHLRDAESALPELAAGGFAREFAERLAATGETEPLQLNDGLWVLPYSPWTFMRLADDLVRETPNLDLLYHATLTRVEVEGDRVARAQALAWNTFITLRPASVVDCTGEATAAALAGGPTEEGLHDQAPAFVFVMENADPGFADRGFLDTLRALRRGVELGLLPPGCDRIAMIPGAGRVGRVAFKLNLAPAHHDSPDWRQVTEWERTGREQVDRIQEFLIENVGSFRHARLGLAAAQLGVRSGRRIVGRAVLSEHDVLACAKPEDGVARGCWPIESWGDAPRPAMTYFPERDYYEIPLDCLRARGLENVFTAGRCLSATPLALASARVIGAALGTGWAAGTAAACLAASQSLAAAVKLIRTTQFE